MSISFQWELNKELEVGEEGWAKEDLHQFLIRIEKRVCIGGGVTLP